VGVPSYAVPAYIAVVALVAVGLAVLAWRKHPLTGDDVVALVVLCLMGILSESVRENDAGQKIPLSFTSIILISAVAIVGPFGAAIVGAVTNLLVAYKAKVQARIFNAAMASAFGVVGGFAYLIAGGSTEVASVEGVGPLLLEVGVPLMVAHIIQCLGNAVILAGIVRLAQGTPMRRFIMAMLGSSGPAYIGYGIIGFLFVIMWVPAGVGPASAVLILAPLFVARWAFVQYGDEQRAHERTLSALAAAVETKDLYTRGHSDRVALLCNLMAESLALSSQDTEALRYAGMLHDIGKLAIPTRVLRKPGGVSDADLVSIAGHAAQGVKMVRDIEFLEHSLEAILHHHERMDGHGYPDGLAGESIPLFARIIAVADAFDSLTTSRFQRDAGTVEDALAELRRREGTQFDPVIVDALERGLDRHPWEPTQLEPTLMVTVGRAFDHDDPRASDLMAGLEGHERVRRADQGVGSVAATESWPRKDPARVSRAEENRARGNRTRENWARENWARENPTEVTGEGPTRENPARESTQ
jgi:putative nucleotidyltransferase with HDIG domain